jgi:holo-[acyl-carrier protein] synthase
MRRPGTGRGRQRSSSPGRDFMRVGIDLLCIDDVASSLDRFGARYIERVFTPGEHADCLSETGPAASSLAARFAAKEAALKVLRHDGHAIPWTSVEIVRAPAGWCELRLHGPAASLADAQGLGGFGVSLSHDGRYATAVVIAEEHGEEHRRD